jgi:NAD(P)-dependent dehydrogenase (short-subunit alcohol dehydrogenase family)
MAEAGRLQQRRVLITGAASGIGRRTALLFTAEGAALTLLDRTSRRAPPEDAPPADNKPLT